MLDYAMNISYNFIVFIKNILRILHKIGHSRIIRSCSETDFQKNLVDYTEFEMVITSQIYAKIQIFVKAAACVCFNSFHTLQVNSGIVLQIRV